MLPVTVQFLVAILAYGLNERMARNVEYLREENRVLKEALVAAPVRSLRHQRPAKVANTPFALAVASHSPPASSQA